ncbi:MAG TPA: hypothetical protein ENF47_04055 [Thermoprotei archaeon]|nr:hypothetical protein [Thermoprotei archaeon]
MNPHEDVGELLNKPITYVRYVNSLKLYDSGDPVCKVIKDLYKGIIIAGRKWIIGTSGWEKTGKLCGLEDYLSITALNALKRVYEKEDVKFDVNQDENHIIIHVYWRPDKDLSKITIEEAIDRLSDERSIILSKVSDITNEIWSILENSGYNREKVEELCKESTFRREMKNIWRVIKKYYREKYGYQPKAPP